MPDKYINIHNLKISESLSKFVEEELLTETDMSSEVKMIMKEKEIIIVTSHMQPIVN